MPIMNNNETRARDYYLIIEGNSSVDRLLCVFLVERFAVRISPLSFFTDAPYMCGSQKRSGKIILGVPQPS